MYKMYINELLTFDHHYYFCKKDISQLRGLIFREILLMNIIYAVYLIQKVHVCTPYSQISQVINVKLEQKIKTCPTDNECY